MVILLLLCLLTSVMGFLDVWYPQQYQNDQMPFPISAILVPGCLLWFAVFVPPQAPLLYAGEGQGRTCSTPLWLPPQQDSATACVARRAAWGGTNSCPTALLCCSLCGGVSPPGSGGKPISPSLPGWLGIREERGPARTALQCLPKNVREDCIS